MNIIAKLLKEWRAAQPSKPELQRRIDQSIMIDFNYNSNHLVSIAISLSLYPNPSF
jgi:hypothetical protein